MTLEDTIDLLAVAAAFDRRTVGEADAIAWHAALGDLNLADSREAVIAHYRDSRDFVMPADIRERVKIIRRNRVADAEIPPPPRELLGNHRAYAAALRAATAAIADGRDPAPAIAAATNRARRELEAS